MYDAFGRRTTATDGTTAAYYTRDTVRQFTKGSTRTTWGLDAADRQATVFDEYGAPDATGGYGWLGTAARAADAPGGLLMLGARGYDPATGTLLQTDPVPGGGDNAYGYCSGDPRPAPRRHQTRVPRPHVLPAPDDQQRRSDEDAVPENWSHQHHSLR
ncbi:hypothetical protein [Streptomyces sp. SAS_276]|uniref:hypothetical protein n=1 Tax=Streptomyces sp. SAS_276 TaxID=3412745 RepID=UPI00403CE18F